MSHNSRNYNTMTKHHVQQMANQVTQMTANINTRLATPGYCPRFSGKYTEENSQRQEKYTDAQEQSRRQRENSPSTYAQDQSRRLQELKNNLQKAKMALKMKDKAAFKERQLTKAASSKWAQSMALVHLTRSV